jgi:hypothetical protein
MNNQHPIQNPAQASNKAIAKINKSQQQPPVISNELLLVAPEMHDALIGARKALLSALEHIPADQQHFCGEWLIEVNEVLGRLHGWVDGQPNVNKTTWR